MTGKTWQVTFGSVALPCRDETDARLLARELVKKGHRVAANTLTNVSPPRRIESHQIEAWQSRFELFAQSTAHLHFHQLRAGQQTQPEPQRLRVFGSRGAVEARFLVHGQSPSASANVLAADCALATAASNSCCFCSSR